MSEENKPAVVFTYKKSFLSILQIVDIDLTDLIYKCIQEIRENEICEVEPEITIMGKKCNMRRNVGFVSDETKGYSYSNQITESNPTSKNFRKLLRKVNKIYNSEFNSILINEYEDGTKYIGRHKDNEKDLDPEAGVVALSVGVRRKFRIRKIGEDIDENGKKHIPSILYEHVTGNYELMQMGGKFQTQLTHEIPIEKNIGESRISFTFRKFIK